MNDGDNPLDDLLANIDRLTLPNRTKIIQDEIAGQPPRTVKITLPALLEQLEDAIRGTVGIGGSGSLPNERNMLDSDALLRFLTIKSQIGEWARDAKATVDPMNPAATLRAWYTRWVEKPREHGSVKFHIGKTRQWIEQIDAKLDPPRVRELPDSCPECGATEWWNPADKHRYLHPLIVEYRPTGADMVQEAIGKCRACDKRWSARELAYEIEQMNVRQSDAQVELDLRTTTV